MLKHFRTIRRQNPAARATANRYENALLIDWRMAILILVYQNENCLVDMSPAS